MGRKLNASRWEKSRLGIRRLKLRRAVSLTARFASPKRVSKHTSLIPDPTSLQCMNAHTLPIIPQGFLPESVTDYLVHAIVHMQGNKPSEIFTTSQMSGIK